ncbi:hypothetical protein WA026_011313 [Henosepilachna vigintioctopunctata]|uniref:14-3-3 domain-containing protein n=1 Tax=Henosepilachna vigintioctopunctata TaxID=420089 RepID=A0AAW1TX76_9CUCU
MSSLTKDRAFYVAQARLCDSAGRLNDMIKYIKLLIETGTELNDEEISQTSYAYKCIIKDKRKQYKIIDQIYVESEASEVIDLLEKNIFPKIMDPETKVCCLMMKADYCRYLAEISSDDKRSEYADRSLKIYQEALDLARVQLATTNPVRLNLALNFSVLHYDVLNSSRSACLIAKQAFDEAILDIENLNEENLTKTTQVMKLLTDNLLYGKMDNKTHKMQFLTMTTKIFSTFSMVPDGVPVITVDKSSLEQGGPLISDCSAPASFPALNLTWYVNDQRVPGSTSFWTIKEGDHLEKSFSRLELTGVGGSWGSIQLRCEANLFRLFRANSLEVTVRPDVPQPASVLLMGSSQTDGKQHYKWMLLLLTTIITSSELLC